MKTSNLQRFVDAVTGGNGVTILRYGETGTYILTPVPSTADPNWYEHSNRVMAETFVQDHYGGIPVEWCRNTNH